MTRLHRGLLITFEGIEGSGKTTQLAQLAKRLREKGHRVIETREPGGTPFAERIRQLLLNPIAELSLDGSSLKPESISPECETFLVFAARSQHVTKVIEPALNEGAIVLCDRFSDSTLAYQGYARGLHLQLLRDINEGVTKGIEPDLTLLFDVPVSIGLARRQQQETKQNRLDLETLEFHERVRKGFLDLAKGNSRRIRTIEATSKVEVIAFHVETLVTQLIDNIQKTRNTTTEKNQSAANTKLAENLRYDRLGQIYAWFPPNGSPDEPKSNVPLTFHDFATKAFYLTCQTIEELENSVQVFNRGKFNSTAIALWFLSLESFVNSLLKIVCLNKALSFSDFKKKDLSGRLNEFVELAGLEKELFQRSGIVPRLEEFKAFRNEIFHDRYGGEESIFRKTLFSKLPFLCNQIDVMQSLIICLEVFSSFSKVFNKLNLMPDIVVEVHGSFAYIKLDVLYQQFTKPYFEQVLKKHQLSTMLNLDFQTIRLKPSPLDTSDLRVVIRSISDEERFSPDPSFTTIGKTLFEAAKSKIPNADFANNFRLPHYMEQ